MSENSFNDKRQEYRLQGEERVYIALPNLSDDSETPYQIHICTSVDMSANGFQLILDHELPAHHYFEICIHLKNPDQQFHLVAESRWCRSTSADDYLIGFTICDADGRDTASWKNIIAARLLSSFEQDM